MLQPVGTCVGQKLSVLAGQTQVKRHPGLLQRGLQYTPGLTHSCHGCHKGRLPLGLYLLLLLLQLLLLHHTLTSRAAG
jgi:hypothetical protein